MSESDEQNADVEAAESATNATSTAADLARTLAALDARCPFDRTFFLRQLGGLIRDRCPDPAEAQPRVEMHLLGGEVLEVCHVIGLAPSWLALAVYDEPEREAHEMRTEMVPYAAITRITIRASADSRRIGFDTDRAPMLLTATSEAEASAERLLEATSTPPAEASMSAPSGSHRR